MAIIVVGGGGRGAGKTALVCGLLHALPEISWTAIKVTAHEHGKAAPIWEETAPGQETDTARYLAAGARRALLVTASEGALGPIVQQVLRECMPPAGAINTGEIEAGTINNAAIGAGVIFESNSILRHVQPDVCLCAATSPWVQKKPSYDLVLERVDAMVELAGHDHIVEAEKITFRLASMERVSATMQEWLRERLGAHW